MSGAAPDHLAERPKQSKQQNITYLKSILMNMINKLPIAAAVLGLALVFTQSAFKNTTQDPNYYRDPQTNECGHWVAWYPEQRLESIPVGNPKNSTSARATLTQI